MWTEIANNANQAFDGSHPPHTTWAVGGCEPADQDLAGSRETFEGRIMMINIDWAEIGGRRGSISSIALFPT